MPTVENVRRDFPILSTSVRGKPLVYLDNAATTQKPKSVVEAMSRFYYETNANVHRSIHALGEKATEAYLTAHSDVARFIGAKGIEEVVFTKNCTEALNIVAYGYARTKLKAGDEVVVSLMEHHSNFVPWQQMCLETGAKLRVVPVTPEGRLPVEAVKAAVNAKTKIVSVTGMSNVLGTIPDARAISEVAHDVGAVSVLDGAQSVPHSKTDVRRIGCDFLVASGHKMLGPTGIGFLYGKREILERTSPFLFGGEMIKRVTVDSTRFNDLPWKFEAGTPVIAEAVGLSAAIAYLERLGMEWVERHEREVTAYAMKRLADVPDLKIYGPPANERGAVVAFALADIHAHDLASLLDEDGIAIRAGHHCAQPLMDSLGVPSTARASFYVYSTRDEVDALAASLERARKVFGLG